MGYYLSVAMEMMSSLKLNWNNCVDANALICQLSSSQQTYSYIFITAHCWRYKLSSNSQNAGFAAVPDAKLLPPDSGTGMRLSLEIL